MKTIFEKIIAREIPADIVYEDDISIAFLVLHPQSKGHLIVVPKIPYGRVHLVPDDILAKLIVISKKIIVAMMQGLSCDYVQVEMVGLGVPEHFHIHLVPRMESDHIPESPYQEYENSERELYVNSIKNAL
jgi:histidine triad (HIT) family protein